MPHYPQPEVLIGGSWRQIAGDRPIIDPATGEKLGFLPQCDIALLTEAVAAAEAGFRVWSRTAPAKRCRIMLEATRLIRERADGIASVMTLEQGKPYAQALLEVERACAIFEWDANEGLRTYGRVIPSAPEIKHTVIRRPIGPVAAFSPWNFPASSPARKIGGALGAGCSIILKPAEETPATAMLLARAFQDAGLPAGVLNVVYGEPAPISEFLIRQPEIRLVTFTGSVPVGKTLTGLAGEYMKPVIMELGGHAPVIVCADADPLRAAKLSVAGKSRNAGQVCVSPTRFLVHNDVYDEFIMHFGRLASEVGVSNGFDTNCQMGPVVSQRRLEAIEALVADAIELGGRCLAGGKRIDSTGFFYPLTVLADVPFEARAMQEEPFGPLALIHRVSSLEEAVAAANSLPYALAAYAFTDSALSINLLSEEIECGNLAINHLTASLPETPFGGVKDSGHGREGGIEGLEGYTVTKLVSVVHN